jgi:hypothetical protein
MSDGRDQNYQASLQFTRRVLSWDSSKTLVHIIVIVLVFAHFAVGQRLFEVNNPKNQHWPEAEADRIYLSTARDLATEFRLPQVPRARFTLVLGADENSVDINTKELRLKKWDKYLYAEGVLRFGEDAIGATSGGGIGCHNALGSGTCVKWSFRVPV